MKGFASKAGVKKGRQRSGVSQTSKGMRGGKANKFSSFCQKPFVPPTIQG